MRAHFRRRLDAYVCEVMTERASARAALAPRKADDRSATLPYGCGTYWLVRFHGASCEHAPPA